MHIYKTTNKVTGKFYIGEVIVDNGCKGRTWNLVEGKRIWYDKYNIVEEQ